MKKLGTMAALGLLFAGCAALGFKFKPDWNLRWAVACVLGLAAFSEAAKVYLNFSLGRTGEGRVLRALTCLPDDYVAVTNWVPQKKGAGDVDLLVLGPHGVLVLEVKFWTVPVGCDGDRWYRIHDNGYRKPMKSPTSQAKRNAKDVGRALSAAGCSFSVVPWVVFNNGAQLTLCEPTVPVLRIRELAARVSGLPSDSRMDVQRALTALLVETE